MATVNVTDSCLYLVSVHDDMYAWTLNDIRWTAGTG